MTMFIGLLYQRNDEARRNDETPALLFVRYSTTPSFHYCTARSASARGVRVTFDLQLADASHDIDHPGNEGEYSRHRHDEPQRQKS